VRIWTLHPKYLDTRGLVALWRECLLARAVLRGQTKGYRHHPQLQRFRMHPHSLGAINAYLRVVLVEANARGYAFDSGKVGPARRDATLRTKRGQLAFEWQHLLRKLRERSPEVYRARRRVTRVEPHPLFRIVAGGIESWERNHGVQRRKGNRAGSIRRPAELDVESSE
jgi:hypothetical protein